MFHVNLIIFFCIGYLAIIFEHVLHINKAAIALVMGVVCWMLYFAHTHGLMVCSEMERISDVAQIIFFLLAAMTIVELIDSHHGFKLITDVLYASSNRKIMWFLIVIGFFMSSCLDNLTSMIVMVSLLKKMLPKSNERWIIGSILVIAVNAGGAWTPIGDVTTTMLWINNKISSWHIIKMLFIPSVICCAVAGIMASFLIKGGHDKEKDSSLIIPRQPGARRVLFLGVGSLIMIPVWKAFLGLPPFMGALIGLGLLWLVTDLIHFSYGEERWHLRVIHILTKIDMSGILFFLGILLAIGTLSEAGILKNLAIYLENVLPSQNYVAVFIGLLSSIIDNVPLVAATMGMYEAPMDASIWQLIAYAAGTGGSILIIGSAAGVAFMGLEKVSFIWYLKNISWIALTAYFIGFFSYFLLCPLWC